MTNKMTDEKVYIPLEWVQEYKNAVWEKLNSVLNHSMSANLFDELESENEHLNFDNPSYVSIYTNCYELPTPEENLVYINLAGNGNEF